MQLLILFTEGFGELAGLGEFLGLQLGTGVLFLLLDLAGGQGSGVAAVVPVRAGFTPTFTLSISLRPFAPYWLACRRFGIGTAPSASRAAASIVLEAADVAVPVRVEDFLGTALPFGAFSLSIFWHRCSVMVKYEVLSDAAAVMAGQGEAGPFDGQNGPRRLPLSTLSAMAGRTRRRRLRHKLPRLSARLRHGQVVTRPTLGPGNRKRVYPPFPKETDKTKNATNSADKA